MEPIWFKKLKEAVNVSDNNVDAFDSVIGNLHFNTPEWFNESKHYHYDREDDTTLVFSRTISVSWIGYLYLQLKKLEGKEEYDLDTISCIIGDYFYIFNNIKKSINEDGSENITYDVRAYSTSELTQAQCDLKEHFPSYEDFYNLGFNPTFKREKVVCPVDSPESQISVTVDKLRKEIKERGSRKPIKPQDK